jgi:hypothetical protein
LVAVVVWGSAPVEVDVTMLAEAWVLVRVNVAVGEVTADVVVTV